MFRLFCNLLLTFRCLKLCVCVQKSYCNKSQISWNPYKDEKLIICACAWGCCDRESVKTLVTDNGKQVTFLFRL